MCIRGIDAREIPLMMSNSVTAAAGLPSLLIQVLRETPGLNLTMYLPVVSPSYFSMAFNEVGAARVVPAMERETKATKAEKKRIVSW